jgi:cysteine desulfurase
MYDFGNASSMHARGREAKAAIEKARAEVAGLIGADPAEIIFNGGGSEGNNTVLNTMWAQIHSGNRRKEIIVSSIEHPSVLEMAKFLETLGFKIHYLPVNKSGHVEIKKLEQVLSDRTLLVSVMLANNETGAIQDVVKITSLAKKAGALVHTDAVQAVGKIPVDVNDLGIDYLTMSAHKIGGPKGVGALYVRAGAPLVPLIHGGHQEHGLRAGTYNSLGIIGFGEAARLAPRFNTKKVADSRDKLKENLFKFLPNVVANTPAKDALPNILNVSFLGAEGESILLALDRAGIEISTGSACASDSIEPSHVLMAQYDDAEIAHGSIRFSLGYDTTDAEISRVVKVLPPIIERLRKTSTIGGQYV